MIWKHHYSLLLAAGMTVALLVTRPDFTGWELLPSVVIWGSGHAIIIKLGRQKMSPERAALKERLEMEKMKVEYRRKMMYSWEYRHAGLLIVLITIVVFVAMGAWIWLGTYGMDGVRELLALLGCGC